MLHAPFRPTGVGPTDIRENQRRIYDAVPGLRGQGKVALFDDFLGDALDARFSGASGTDGSDPAINAAVPGTVRLTTGGTAGMSSNISALTHGLNWQADQGGLLMKARAKLDAVASGYMFVGFTDALATGTLELPFELDASDVLTANADDAVGLLYDSTGTGNWFLVGVAGTTAVGPTDTGLSPADDTYDEIEVQVNADGNAEFILNGQSMGRLNSAVGASTALTPATVASADGSARNADVDYLLAVQDR